ncbi:hypothetical protein NPIL_504361 [Nephila pilipes]|uniref:Uncharacterized protein n=1 Tax=Nephila pilipes TaxID=299642 RepID=A0A8X6NTG1_NEPPI|nr:hypothetical protein NPIL_504361 [Nephila pilipes]
MVAAQRKVTRDDYALVVMLCHSRSIPALVQQLTEPSVDECAKTRGRQMIYLFAFVCITSISLHADPGKGLSMDVPPEPGPRGFMSVNEIMGLLLAT